MVSRPRSSWQWRAPRRQPVVHSRSFSTRCVSPEHVGASGASGPSGDCPAPNTRRPSENPAKRSGRDEPVVRRCADDRVSGVLRGPVGGRLLPRVQDRSDAHDRGRRHGRHPASRGLWFLRQRAPVPGRTAHRRDGRVQPSGRFRASTFDHVFGASAAADRRRTREDRISDVSSWRHRRSRTAPAAHRARERLE